MREQGRCAKLANTGGQRREASTRASTPKRLRRQACAKSPLALTSHARAADFSFCIRHSDLSCADRREGQRIRQDLPPGRQEFCPQPLGCEQSMDAGLKAGEQHGAQRAERGWERTRTRALSTRALSDARRQRDRPVAWKERDEPRPPVDLARHATLLQAAWPAQRWPWCPRYPCTPASDQARRKSIGRHAGAVPGVPAAIKATLVSRSLLEKLDRDCAVMACPSLPSRIALLVNSHEQTATNTAAFLKIDSRRGGWRVRPPSIMAMNRPSALTRAG